jgi:hypothetical protein
VSPVKYELGFYIAEDDILHSQGRDILKSYRPVDVRAYHHITGLLTCFRILT